MSAGHRRSGRRTSALGLAALLLIVRAGSATASDPFPWTYRGSLESHVTATADHGVRGTVSCSVTGATMRVTLHPDGTVTGEVVHDGYYVRFGAAGEGLSCRQDEKRLEATVTGSHRDGSVTLTTSRGMRFTGRYDEATLSASGTAKQSVILTGGRTATASLTRLVSLVRER